MAGQSDSFGWTTKEKDGVVWNAHIWPLELFKRHFTGWGPHDVEDWKAAIYKWGGPRPSRIKDFDITFDPNIGAVLVLWIERQDDAVPDVHEGQRDVSHSEDGAGTDVAPASDQRA